MKMNKESVIIGSIAAAFLVFFAALIYLTPRPAPQSSNQNGAAPADTALLIRSTTHMTASSTAKVNLVEFGDYQCPACGQIQPVLEQIIETYNNNPDFNFAFRHFPLPQHSNAMIAAEAAEAAGAQGKFWEMHRTLYVHQNEWSESTSPAALFAGYAQTIGLDAQKFNQDIQNHAYESLILGDKGDAVKLMLNHTPTIFLNGTEITDFSYAGIKSKIDTALTQ